MKKILLTAGLLLLALIGVLLFNAFRFPKAVATRAEPLPALSDSAVQHFQEALRLPTISWAVDKPIDTAAFMGFERLLTRAYPLLHQRLHRQVFGQFSYLYHWPGTDSSLAPIVLMGHYDVVPVEAVAEKMWRQPPFSGALIADTVWGRGAVDDKGAVMAILEATEALLRQGFQPRRGVYLCFGHDEEIGGTRGAAVIANWMKAQGIRAHFVIDEGGMIKVDEQIATQPLAVIGIQEKGYASYKLRVELPGGHSSQPLPETAIDILTKAMARLRAEPTPARITPATQAFLEAVASVSPSVATRMAVANQWILGGILKSELSKDKLTNAMIRTTLVPTMLNAGVKDNVIPAVAEAVVNSRILPGETPETVKAYMAEKIADSRVVISAYDENRWAPSGQTNLSGPAYKAVSGAVGKVIDNAVPAPYLVIGATDSRYFRQICSEVMNFSATTFMEGYHGIDERLPVSEYRRMIAFITHVIKDSQ
jgi:carboxypeptidase PM20D1